MTTGEALARCIAEQAAAAAALRDKPDDWQWLWVEDLLKEESILREEERAIEAARLLLEHADGARALLVTLPVAPTELTDVQGRPVSRTVCVVAFPDEALAEMFAKMLISHEPKLRRILA